MSVSRPPSSRRNARARRNGTWRWARPCEKALSGRAPASRSASAGGKLDTLGGRSTDGSGDVKTQHAELFFWQAWQAVEEDWKHGKTTSAQLRGSTNQELSVAKDCEGPSVPSSSHPLRGGLTSTAMFRSSLPSEQSRGTISSQEA